MCVCKDTPALTGLVDGSPLVKEALDAKVIEDHGDFAVTECKECGQKWILNRVPAMRTNDPEIYTKVRFDYQLDDLKEFLRHDLSAGHLKAQADKIGASNEDYYEAPCKATLKDGRVIDFAVLQRWPIHPRSIWPTMPVQQFVYADEVERIEPSDYALSLEHRKVMRDVYCTDFKDYIPVYLVVDDKTYFKTTGSMLRYFDANFLRYKDVKGKDITEVSGDWKKYSDPIEQDDLKKETTVILFDRF